MIWNVLIEEHLKKETFEREEDQAHLIFQQVFFFNLLTFYEY